MKNYAYVMLNGVSGNVIRAHWVRNRQPVDHPAILAELLSDFGYEPFREIVLPNSSVLLILAKEDGLRSAKRKAPAPKPAR